MHRQLQYMFISMYLMVIGIQAYNHNEQGCLTWEIRRNRLILTCRLTNLSKQVYLIDNHEQEYIRCTLKEKINSCISPHASQSIFVNSSINAITLTIRKIDKNNVDGKWKCKQGKHAYETEVSGAKGIISATDIHLNSEILNTGTAQKVKLKCYSCREPRHKYAEFLVNGTSTDGISYNKTSDKCSNQYGECKSHVCSCHRSGNEFINIFNVSNVFGTNYSCEMRFNDNDKKSIFSMERTVYVNDTVFYSASEMKLIKPPSKGNDKKIKTEMSGNLNEKEIMFDNVSEKKLTIPANKGNDKNRRTEDTDIAWTWIQNGYFLVAVLTFPTILCIYCYCVLSSSIVKGPSKSKTYAKPKSLVLIKDKDVSTNSGTEDPSKSKTYEKQKRLLLSKDKDVSTYSGTEAICMHEDTLTNENAKQDIQMETKTFLYSQGNQDTKDKMTDVLHHDTCVQEQTVTNGNRTQDMEMKPIKVLHSPGYTDAIDNMVDVLYIKIGEPNITVETEADTFLQNRNKMSKKSKNDFDEQKEEYIESIHHEIGMEFTSTKGTEREWNLKIWCQPCQKTNNNVPACHRCLNCEEAVCECCKEIHSKKHKLEKITPLHNEIKISNWCSNHHDHQYQYFCEDHYRLCCHACMSIDHRDCVIITSIADASKGFKSSEVVEKYKRVLKTISKSFDDLKDIIEQGRNDVNQNTCDFLSELEMNCHLVFERDELQHFKELFPKHVQDDKNICLSKLQKQLSVVYKCKFFIHIIETSLESIIQQWHEEQVFRTVLISTKFLASTLKKVISDTESIKLVFNPMSVGDKHVMFGIREKERVITQNLTALLARKRRDEYGTQHIFTDFRNNPI